MIYVQGKGWIDFQGNKVGSKRKINLERARIAGYENDTDTFLRLRVESGISYPYLKEQWLKGVVQREAV